MSSEDPPVPPDQSQSSEELKPLDRSGTFWAEQKNAANLVLGRLSKADEALWSQLEEIKQWDSMYKKCEQRKEYLLKYSPIIRFMNDKLGAFGGRMTADLFPCNFCTQSKSGGFNPHFGVELCANKLNSSGHQEDTMAHEMVHIYDHLRFKVDWRNLRHAACSEIRASALSGECRFTQEFIKNGQWKMNKGYQDCVRRRAILSIKARPFCRDEAHARQVIDEVWDSCLMDTRPFDEVYR